MAWVREPADEDVGATKLRYDIGVEDGKDPHLKNREMCGTVGRNSEISSASFRLHVEQKVRLEKTSGAKAPVVAGLMWHG